MFYWDQVWREHEAVLEGLSSSQRKNLVFQCLQDVWMEYKDDFNLVLSDGQKQLIASVVEGVASGNTAKHKSYLIALDAELGQSLAPGVCDLFMGFVQLIESFDMMSSDDALEAMSFAYQVVLDKEVLSNLEKETLEAEVRQLEVGNKACLRTINRQLELMSLVGQVS